LVLLLGKQRACYSKVVGCKRVTGLHIESLLVGVDRVLISLQSEERIAMIIGALKI
jgi:hypothetical protein